ncbi:MAG: RimK family alpha-L-glutamate ligase [Atribacterota bacterium]|jgi:gamma-F420-2:alpha-L-glutamate ligase|nr:RimK family alpha-L-glutamate ligase [Atribacterota bacterium]MDY0382868.1 RimK family alpha-L-glutamate ligase [Atribacterota bacterium]
MEGWILYRQRQSEISQDKYEMNRFLEVAEQRGINLKILCPEQFDLLVNRDDNKSIIVDNHYTQLPQFLLPRQGAGTPYFSLAVIRHLERLGVNTFNSSQSIEVVKDKLFTQQILAADNFPVPRTILARYPLNIQLIKETIGFPIVVKTISGSQGSGVFLCEKPGHLEDLMQLLDTAKTQSNFIVQEFIKTSKGHDVRVFIVGGRVIACMERISRDGSFKANFSRGGEVRAFPVSREIEWLSIECAKVLNLDIAGIDLLFDGESFKICEANSAPGFKGIESCCDVSIPDVIFDFIKVRLGLLF